MLEINHTASASVHVSSELGVLKRILIHSPDGGIGKITPGKFHDWLYDDTVHLQKMQQEYDDYVKLLLYFLDPEKMEEVRTAEAGTNEKDRPSILNPGREEYFRSHKVVDAQWILSEILKDDKVRERIITAISAIESCNSKVQQYLEGRKDNGDYILDNKQLAKTLITGVLPTGEETGVLPPDTEDMTEEIYIFPPVPNFVFTRDIAIVIKDHLLLSKPAKLARRRESILTKFLAQHYLLKGREENIIEITQHSEFFLLDEKEQAEQIITIEGGDIMMIAHNHLIVGCSERTSPNAVNEIVHEIFKLSDKIGIEWISVVKIPKKRSQMHIDTIFTHVRRDVWVLHGEFSREVEEYKAEVKKTYLKDLMHKKERNEMDEEESVEIIQFYKDKQTPYNKSSDYLYKYDDHITQQPEYIDDLLKQISAECYGVPYNRTKIIYSGGNRYPYDSREQWTDACNVLALKEGIVIGYDRNVETIKEFEKEGFECIAVKKLLHQFETGERNPQDIKNMLVLLESGELSRARGGSHCMSMPLWREELG
ncbi:MAG: arginine deiminase family protein [Bacteroidia bacterium]